MHTQYKLNPNGFINVSKLKTQFVGEKWCMILVKYVDLVKEEEQLLSQVGNNLQDIYVA